MVCNGQFYVIKSQDYVKPSYYQTLCTILNIQCFNKAYIIIVRPFYIMNVEYYIYKVSTKANVYLTQL